MSVFRSKVLTFERIIGTFAAIPHPVAIEVISASGVDFICIDAEHSQIDRELLENLVRAADVHSMPSIVRVPSHGSEWIATALDAGAKGVLIPRVSTADQAHAAVMATRYPPTGERGVGPGRASGYGYRMPDYLKDANESIVLAVQIETAEGLENVETIVAVEGVDVIFIGPGDLSVSIDATGIEGAERLNLAISTIANAARLAGKVVGIFRPTVDDVRLWSDQGISFFLIASDTMFLGAGLVNSTKIARIA